MKKNFYQVVIFSVVLFCMSSSMVGLPIKEVSAKSIGHTAKESVKDLLPPLAPVANTPIYYCQNATAVALIATPDTGNTLIWYGTSATGGTASTTAPTPLTTTVGSFFYYVSQTDGATESPRTQITVNVVADNGAVILLFRCDPGFIAAADKASSVFFDWANNPLISNTYNYTYSIQGGSPASSSTSVSHLQVFGMLPGQSATMTLTSATHPCVPPQTLTCSVPCGTATVTPNFPALAPFCTGSVAPVLGPTSPNGISGSWSPAVVSNTVSGNYVFTPDPFLFPCATTQTVTSTVSPLVTPTFSNIPTTVCQNDTPPTLPTNSNNTPSISGSWLPATVSTATLGAADYTFTPNPGQCTVLTPTKVTITVVANNSPNFSAIPPLCSGSTAPILSTTSPSGVIGSWAPSVVSNTTNGSYVFTPNPNQCSTIQTLDVTIIPRRTPDFAAINPICTGDTPPALSTTSPNGISGSWIPSAISNTASGSYVFTPAATECAFTQSLTVTVNPLQDPGFSSFVICEGSVPPILNTTSPNGISGSWNPMVIDNSTTANYVFTPDVGECAAQQTIIVTVNPSNTLVDFDWTVTEAFSENQIVTVNATAAGNYLYQLDFGPVQESPIFEQVSYGVHSITVSEPAGCSDPIKKTGILVIDYPRVFTPNGDGFYDTWNVSTLRTDLTSTIKIFDRYGKFLIEIAPKGNGWDGNYNGRLMPSTDYWFVINYEENGVQKIYRSHFALKR